MVKDFAQRLLLVIKTHDYKVQLVRFGFLNYKLELLDGLNEGEKVEVTFRVDGRIGQRGQVLNNLIGTELVKLSENEVKQSIIYCPNNIEF